MKIGTGTARIAILASSLFACTAVFAQAVVTTQNPDGELRTPLTPEMRNEIRNAKPHVNPLPPPDDADATKPESVIGDEAKPGVRKGSQDDPPRKSSRAFGSFGVPFTEQRVALGASSTTATVANLATFYLGTTSPYRRIGRLTFTKPTGGSFLCSASLIRRSVIVTAAHCVQAFGGVRYNDWKYAPAHYDDGTLTQPFGVWTWSAVTRPAKWINGTDTGSGSARNNDLALLILNKNASGKFVGELTGYLGYGWNNYSFVSHARTGNLSTAETATLGYPGLIDLGKIMQRTDGPSYLTTLSSALQIYQGNPFTGGSSGGPWIVNFKARAAVYSGGAGEGTHPDANIVVGVTSWGTSDPNAIKDNYSSRFGQNTQYPNADYGGFGAGNIGALLNAACSTVKGGGTQTYKQLGYRD